jgi:AcrR family transcriptional regulator/DNA-binding PadR family transcriptional regulator
VLRTRATEDADRSKIGQRRPSSSSGGSQVVSELQRARLLDAVFAVVAEVGYRGMAVRAVTERAGVSSKTFYDLFIDREDCFLAAFDYGVQRLGELAGPAYRGERDWAAGIRAGLAALLGFLDGEPALRTLVFVEALGAGPRVLERRVEVSRQLRGVVERGQAGVKVGGGLPVVIAEGLLGATFGVIHARLLERPPGPLSGLCNELTAMIVLPYRGRAAAKRELSRPAPQLTTRALKGTGGGVVVGSGRPLGSGPVSDFRMTVRTQTVLQVVAEYPGLSNQRVSDLARIPDQGHISRLMMRLVEQGFVENTRRGGQGAPKAWHLTREGEEVIRANQPLRPEHRIPPSTEQVRASSRAATSSGAARLTARGREERRGSGAVRRLTARTHLVLSAIAELGTGDLAPSNREISHAAGVKDQGQISKILARLESQGLAENIGGRTQGIPNAWRLTQRGEELLHASRSASSKAATR